MNEEIERLRKVGGDTIPGEVVFKLYDTFGFPTDLTADAARAAGFGTDMEGFERSMERQREKARESWKGSGEEAISDVYHRLSSKGFSNAFVGYEGVTEAVARVTAILKNDEEVSALYEGKTEKFSSTRPPSTARWADRSGTWEPSRAPRGFSMSGTPRNPWKRSLPILEK